MPDNFRKFIPIAKVEEGADGHHMVYGIVTAEVPDKDGEIADYPASKAAYTKWSENFLAKTTAAGQDPSLGNVRIMHQLEVGGKVVKLEYHDDTRQIWLGSEPKNDEVWKQLKGGFLTGYSQGGDYAWKKADGSHTRYAPIIGEVSYVDNPCLEEASFAYVKADGSTEMRKFAKKEPSAEEKANARVAELTKQIEDLKKEATNLIALAKAAQEKTVNDKLSDKMQKLAPEDLEKAAHSVVDHLANLHQMVTNHHAMMGKAIGDHMAACHEGVGKCMKALGVPESGMGDIKGGGEVKAAGTTFTKAELDDAIAKAVAAALPKKDEPKPDSIAEVVKAAVAEELAKRTTITGPQPKLVLVGRDGKAIEKTEQIEPKDDELLEKSVGF